MSVDAARRVVPVVVVLVAALLAGGCGSTEAAGPSQVPTVTGPHGAGTGDLLARGVLTRDGKPVRNAVVSISLHPAGPRDPDADPNGDDWYADAEARTDAAGRWRLRLEPAEIPARYVPDDKVFTFGVGATKFRGDGSQDGIGQDVEVALVDGVWRSPGAEVSEGVVRLDLDLDTGLAVLTDSSGRTTRDRVDLVSGSA